MPLKRQVLAYRVNAFTNGTSGGSPTGVVLDAAGLREQEMLFIANQLSTSHTAFVFEPSHSNKPLTIRFFTPKREILNCGHGTIAAHFARATHRGAMTNPIVRQVVRNEVQAVEIAVQGSDVEISFKQSEIQFAGVDPAIVHDLLTALAIRENDLATEFPPVLASPGSYRFLLGLRTRAAVRALSPDFDKLKHLCETTNSLGCFAFSLDSIGPELEATARMFAPSIGVNEDVINGNSSGCLCAYLMQRRNDTQLELRVHQGHAFNREGVVRVRGKKTGHYIETTISGTATIENEMVIELP